MNRPILSVFLPDLRIGGAERIMLQMAEGFAFLGYKVDLVVIRKTGELLDSIPPGVRLVDLRSKSEYTCLPALLRYLINRKPDVLLSTMVLTNLLAIFATRLAGLKTRVVIRAATTYSKQWRSSLLKKRLEQFLVHSMYPLSNGIVAVSKGVADDLATFGRMDRRLTQVIPNPVVTDALLKEISQLKSNNPPPSSAISDSVPFILSVGRLEPEKDFSTLIRAFKMVRQVRQAKLVILGEGKERARLEQLIHTLGIEEDVKLPGYEQRPVVFMKNASVYVLSSIWEGLPNSLIEAMVCGCPVVSTNCPSGPEEILKGGKYGHLVPPGDVNKMADAILTVLSGNGRLPPKEWMDQYRSDRVVKQYLQLFGV